MSNYQIAVVVFDVKRSKIENLVDFLPEFKAKIDEFEKGKVRLIEKVILDSDLEH